MTDITITKAQLQGLLNYMELHNCDGLKCHLECLEDTLKEFGEVNIPVEMPPPQGRGMFTVIQGGKSNGVT